MPRYTARATWKGEAETVIEADTIEQAQHIAEHDTWVGFHVRGGSIELIVEAVEPLEDDDE